MVQTDASGCFEVTLEDPSVDAVEVSAYFDGYISDSKTVTLKTSGNTISFALRRVGEPVLRDLYNQIGSAHKFVIDEVRTDMTTNRPFYLIKYIPLWVPSGSPPRNLHLMPASRLRP